MSNPTFIDNSNVVNLEIGAGCGNFGKKYFPECYLIDNDPALKTSCTSCSIDLFLDIHKPLPWKNDRFETIIMCNPYGYGFNTDEDTTLLLNQLVRIVRNKGSILIIGSATNKHCAPDRINKRVTSYNTSGLAKLDVVISDLDTTKDYIGHDFHTLTGDRAYPNKRVILNVTK